MLKKSNFLEEILIILWIFLQNFIQKYEFYTLKEGPKVKMEKNLRLKVEGIFLGLKIDGNCFEFTYLTLDYK